MKIRTFTSVESGVFKVTIKTEDWSEGDKKLMADFGEPQIDLGGTFDGPAPDYATFQLPDDYVNVMSDSPFTQTFDSRDTSSTIAIQDANYWISSVVASIQSAITTLRTLTDTFTGEHVTVV